MIIKIHPTDPDNKLEKFSILDSITVSNYYLKLNDAFQCVKIYKAFKLLSQSIHNFFY